MNSSPSPPLVLLPACREWIDGRHVHLVPEVYPEALRLAGCQPLLATAVGSIEISNLLEIIDGILLTGSPNNVHPSHFDEEILDPSLPLDPVRDGFTLPLIREAIRRGIPLMGICRGHQEINVALGGSLHQAVHKLPGMNDHQPGHELPPKQRYGAAHGIDIVPGGLLETILGSGQVHVNSVHGQAVNRLGPGLRVEALSPDGVIEAIHMPDAAGFNLGVQWHPEWEMADNPVSVAVFKAFGDACRTYQSRRRPLLPQ